jgi:hypothetical protein
MPLLDEVAVGIVLEDELEDATPSDPKHSSAAAELFEEASADSLELGETMVTVMGDELSELELLDGDATADSAAAAADFKALELLDDPLRRDAAAALELFVKDASIAAALELLVKGASIAAAIATAAASDPMDEAELRFSSFSACVSRDLYNSVSGCKIVVSKGIEG